MNAQALRYKMCSDIARFIEEKLTEFSKETGLIGCPTMTVCGIPVYQDEASGEAVLSVEGTPTYSVLFDISISDRFGGLPTISIIGDREGAAMQEWESAQRDANIELNSLRQNASSEA
jgi:hypothetical protein